MRGVSWLEKSHTLLSLMIVAGAFTGLYVTPAVDAHDPAKVEAIAKFVWPSVVIPCILFSWRRPQKILKKFLGGEPFLLALVLLAIVSTLWSLVPETSLRRSLVLLSFYYLACYLSATYDWSEILGLIRWALRLGLVLSCIAGLVAPQIAIHHGLLDGLWRGLFAHKNSFGRYGGFLLSLTLACRLADVRGGRNFVSFDVVLSLLVLMLSQSKTALIVAGGSLLLSFFIQAWLSSSKSLRLLLGALSLGLMTFLMGLVYLGGGILIKMDHNRLLTGRVSLWKTVLYFWSQKPWTGYGYDAFFQEEAFGRILHLWEDWRVPHAHNTILELLVNLGIFSVLLYLCSLLLFVYRSSSAVGRLKHIVWFVLAFNILSGLTEVGAFPRNELGSLLFIFVTLSAAEERKSLLPIRLKHSHSLRPVGPLDFEIGVGPQSTEPKSGPNIGDSV